MWIAIRASWPLLIGMVFLMVSNGLLATLLTLRASSLGFGETVIGVVQSCYPIGALVGCLIAPRFLRRVGHIRVFAALASIASATALIHLVTFDPLSWAVMRMLAGFCFAGLYIVAESWLNGRATNETRGTLLSIYFVIQTGGAAAGQTLLNLASPGGILLLVITSILISLSLVPILMSASASPPYDVPERISVLTLFRLSPMGLSGCFLNGIAQGAIYVALALYGQAMGFSSGAIGTLIGAMMLGGMLFQFPLGRISDRVDRRLVLISVAGMAVPVALLLAWISQPSVNLVLLYAGVALLGGLTLPIYSICIAHTNDYLKSSQIVAASGMLVLISGVGLIFGPTLGALAVEQFGPRGLFWLLAVIQSCTVATALFRLWRGQQPAKAQASAIAITQYGTPGTAHLNPAALPQGEEHTPG